MANISEAFGVTIVNFDDVKWDQEKQLEFMEILNNILTKGYYYWSLDTVDEISENEIKYSSLGCGRWTMLNTLESLFSSSDNIEYNELERVLNLFLKENEKIKMNIIFSEYEPGCDFLIENSEIHIALSKGYIHFVVFDKGKSLETNKENIMRVMGYDEDYFEDWEEE